MTVTSVQPNKPSKRSPAWMFFQRITVDDRLKAKCLIDGCTTTLSTPFHSTSTLIRHLRDVHKMEDFQSKEVLPNPSNKKKISSHMKKRLDDAVLVAIIEDGRSFSDFSKKGLKKFIQVALPSTRTISSPLTCLFKVICHLGYKPPDRNTITKRLKRLHTKHFFSLINSLEKIPSISISTDFWSDTKGISFLVLTGHYITNDFDLRSTILRFSSFKKRHFSDEIGAEIEKQLLELKVFNKVTSITCDAAPNMVKMFDYLSRPDVARIRCQAHLLHLIVCNGLGFWIDKKKKSKQTNNDEEIPDPDDRLSSSMKKINVFDDDGSMVDSNGFDNNPGGSRAGNGDVSRIFLMEKALVFLISLGRLSEQFY